MSKMNVCFSAKQFLDTTGKTYRMHGLIFFALDVIILSVETEYVVLGGQTVPFCLKCDCCWVKFTLRQAARGMFR